MMWQKHKHVESQNDIANSIEGCSGGMEDVLGKMKKEEMFWGRELFMYYCWDSTCFLVEKEVNNFIVVAGVLRV